MGFISSAMRLTGLSLGLVFAANAMAADEAQLIESINVCLLYTSDAADE